MNVRVAGLVALGLTVALGVGCGGSTKPSAAFCADAQRFANAPTPNGTEANRQAVAMLERLRAESPTSLRDDFDQLLRFARAQSTASSLPVKPDELQRLYDATTRISTYLADHCRIATTTTG